MREVVREFLEASSFMQSMEMTFEKEIEQLCALEISQANIMMLEFFQEHRSEIAEQAANVVAAVFTDLELQKLTEFYRTDLGKMLVSKMPAIGAQVNIILLEWVDKGRQAVEVRLFEQQIERW